MKHYLKLIIFFALTLSFSKDARAQFVDTQAQYLDGVNFIKNPGFENGKTNWTNVSSTFTAQTSTVARGGASALFTTSNSAATLTSTAQTIPQGFYAYSCSLSFLYKTSGAIYQAGVVNGSGSVVSASVTLSSGAGWQLYRKRFACPSSGSLSAKFSVTGATSSSLYIDEVFLGAENYRASIIDADVDASAAIAGSKVNPDFGAQTVKTTGVYNFSNGSAAAVSIASALNAGTGIYSTGANTLDIAANGTKYLEVSSTGNIGLNVTAGQLFTQSGGLASPGLSIGQGGGDGIYLLTTNTLGFSAGGVDVGRVSSAGFRLKATNTNDDAVSGFYGDAVSTSGTNAAVPANATYGDLGSLSLLAGNWIVCLQVQVNRNSATFTSTDFGFGISTTTGNSSTGLVAGDNFEEAAALVPTTFGSYPAPTICSNIKLASTTTHYAKIYLDTYTAGSPKANYKFWAIRPR